MKTLLLLLWSCLAAVGGDVLFSWTGPSGCIGTNVSFRIYEWRGAWASFTNVPWPTQSVRLAVRPGAHWFTVTTCSNGLESEFPRYPTNRVATPSPQRLFTADQVGRIVTVLLTNKIRIPPKP